MGKEMIDHPQHYNQNKNGIEVIDIIEGQDWGAGFNRGNVIKYVLRASYKNPSKEIEDLEKAKWYLEREIERLKKEDREKPVVEKYIPYEEPRAVCIQATPFGTAVVDSCTLKAHKDKG